MVAEAPRSIATCPFPRPTSQSLAGWLSGPAAEPRSESRMEDFLTLRSRERLDHGLPPGLRELAERLVHELQDRVSLFPRPLTEVAHRASRAARR